MVQIEAGDRVTNNYFPMEIPMYVITQFFTDLKFEIIINFAKIIVLSHRTVSFVKITNVTNLSKHSYVFL